VTLEEDSDCCQDGTWHELLAAFSKISSAETKVRETFNEETKQ
jgi:hypothetical protein